MKKNNLFKRLLPVGALLAFGSLAGATVVAPGGTAPAAIDTVGAGSTLLAQTGPTAVAGGTNPTLDATYTEWVYSDPTGLCPGCLDFVIEVHDTSAAPPAGDIIQSVTASSFAGNGAVTTDIGYSPVVLGVGTPTSPVAPTNVDRSGGAGGVVSFDFRPGQINPGQYSDYLIIKTNATWYIPGTVTIQDGVALTETGFGVAPEPNMACLLAVFGVGILGITYRRKKNAAKNTEV